MVNKHYLFIFRGILFYLWGCDFNNPPDYSEDSSVKNSDLQKIKIYFISIIFK
ncbi:MAG: hypothetical protein KatS3mg037_1869 [Ignavibacterium sp.]|nr:MAG: hypothetical protein KatS3mg037_1869 [Ignavibacterium sp.]